MPINGGRWVRDLKTGTERRLEMPRKKTAFRSKGVDLFKASWSGSICRMFPFINLLRIVNGRTRQTRLGRKVE
jgi:hypothetical protein